MFNQLTDQVPLRETIREGQLKLVSVSACRRTNPPINLSFMNQGSGHLFKHEHQERLISIKFCRTFYNLARNLSISHSTISSPFAISYI